MTLEPTKTIVDTILSEATDPSALSKERIDALKLLGRINNILDYTTGEFPIYSLPTSDLQSLARLLSVYAERLERKYYMLSADWEEAEENQGGVINGVM